MKLYYSPAACSLAPHIALNEAGIAVELIKTDVKTKQTAAGADFWAINSKGYVPTLQLDDSQVLTECPVILQYIADQKPASGLAPAAGTMARYRLQEWLNFITSEVHKGMGSFFNPGCKDAWREGAEAYLSRRLDWLNTQLQGRDYLMDSYTVADAYLFTILNWGQFVKFDIGRWPNLKAFQERVAARPAVQQTLRAEGLLK
jgi:glutathione S-transferase